MGMTSSSEQEAEIESNLKELFSGAERVVVVGIGNPFRRDDYVGVEIVRNLQNNVSESIFLIEAETVPESFLDPITKFKPTHILIIDAGIIDQQNPGIPKLADPTQLMNETSISTHTLPLRIFCDYLKMTTAAKIALLIIQPQDSSFGEGLTPKLKQTKNNLIILLQKILP